MLAELQGGTLAYSIRAGGGSQFTLRLPAADVDDPPIEPPIEPPTVEELV
jgi:hypothetical protein